MRCLILLSMVVASSMAVTMVRHAGSTQCECPKVECPVVQCPKPEPVKCLPRRKVKASKNLPQGTRSLVAIKTIDSAPPSSIDIAPLAPFVDARPTAAPKAKRRHIWSRTILPKQQMTTPRPSNQFVLPMSRPLRVEPVIGSARAVVPQRTTRDRPLWDNDYPDEAELQQLDRLPVLRVDAEAYNVKTVNRYNYIRTTMADQPKFVTSTPSGRRRAEGVKQHTAKTKEEKILALLEEAIETSTKPAEQVTSSSRQPSTIPGRRGVERAEYDPMIVINSLQPLSSSKTVTTQTILDIGDSIESQLSAMSTTTTSTTTKTPVTSATTTSKPESSSRPSDSLSGLDSIVADVSQPGDAAEAKVVPVVSAGYKTNPSFATEEVSVEEEKCNDEALLKVLVEGMQVDDSIGSKRSVGALLTAGGFPSGQVSVLCSQQDMAFRLVARKYCQLSAGTATCIAFTV